MIEKVLALIEKLPAITLDINAAFPRYIYITAIIIFGAVLTVSLLTTFSRKSF